MKNRVYLIGFIAAFVMMVVFGAWRQDVLRGEDVELGSPAEQYSAPKNE